MKKIITFILIGIATFCNAQYSGVFVGSCEPGMSEGITGNFATFDRPRGITTDSNGYLYVADTDNNSIRKISPNGNLVTTIASSGINKPFGIVVDQSGNIYVSDPQNHRIQKITPTGVVLTFAGSSQGYANGIGTAAKFNFPFGLTIDASGNIYVADSAYDNVSQTIFGSIRKITPSGLVSTVYTTGYLFKPIGVAIDSLGNLYVADSNSILISKISTSGQLISTFNANAKPWGIALDRMENIYLTINLYTNHPNPAYGLLATLGPNGQVRKITPNGYVTFEVTSGSGLYNPLGLCVNNNNEIFIADVNNNRIAKLTSGGIPNNFAGETCPGLIDGQGEINKAHFNSPNGLGQDSNGNIYVADTENNRIRKITPNGVVSTLVGSIAGFNNGNATQALLDKPRRMFVDSNNNIYTLTKSNFGDPVSYRSIRKISQNGDVSSFPQSNPNLTIYDNSSVGGIVVDQNGNVYVTTYNLIQKITPLGIVSIFAGDWSSGYINGFGTAARFNNPSGLCIDPLGNIYVADSGNNRIRKITPSGLVSTLGSSTIIIFNRPNSIAFNGGNVYFNDISRMYKITANDEVYLVSGGSGGTGGLISNANNLLVISSHLIYGVTDQALETNQNSFTNNQIHLFPNPAKDEITIDFGNTSNVIGGNYKIINMLGQEVQNGDLNSQQNTFLLNNIKGQGIYFVKIYDSSNTLLDTKKIIIQQ